MWVRLALLILFLALCVVALVFQVWGAAIAGALLALALLPQVLVGLRAAIRGQPPPEPRLYLPFQLSRSQQFAAGMVLFGVPLAIWRVFEDGVIALAAIGPLAVLGVVWLAILVRREGWCGSETKDD